MSDYGTHNIPPGEQPRWLERPGNVEKVIWSVIAIAAGLTLADFFYHKHGDTKISETFGFHSWFGLVSGIALVLVVKVMRRLLSRKEDFYDPPAD